MYYIEWKDDDDEDDDEKSEQQSTHLFFYRCIIILQNHIDCIIRDEKSIHKWINTFEKQIRWNLSIGNSTCENWL